MSRRKTGAHELLTPLIFTLHFTGLLTIDIFSGAVNREEKNVEVVLLYIQISPIATTCYNYKNPIKSEVSEQSKNGEAISSTSRKDCSHAEQTWYLNIIHANARVSSDTM